MQKAMFFLESFKRGILAEIDAGFILTVNSPDMADIQHKLDPFRVEMMSYSGVKSIHEIEDGLKFMSSGRKTLGLIEPVNYPNKHQDPAFRSTRSTEHIPFRFAECDSYLTSNSNYKVLLPKKPVECIDSFTVEFPRKGDMCVIYYIFHDDIEGVVLPYIASNLEMILKQVTNLQTMEAKRFSRNFVDNVRRFSLHLHHGFPSIGTSQ